MSGKIRPCVHCGALFRPEFPRGAARTCSDECGKARRRATANDAGKRYHAKNADARNAERAAHSRANRPQRNAAWNEWASRNRDRRNAAKRARYAEQKR